MEKWKKEMSKRNLRFYLKVKGKELWISPEGFREEYFLTRGKISLKGIEKLLNQSEQKTLWEN